ncbi:hypothetical protein VPH35_131515 [Triticum aestivum]
MVEIPLVDLWLAGARAEMKAAVRAVFNLPNEAKRHNTSARDVLRFKKKNEAFDLFDAAAPADFDAFCARLDVPPHARAMHELIVDVAGKVAASLGLEGHRFQFRMNRYNYTHEQIHADSGFLTVLQEDHCVGGLEVLDPATDEFVRVDPVAGSLLVNIGTERYLSNPSCASGVEQRVPRISIALFLLAPKDDRHPRRFQPFYYDDYRKLRLSTGERARSNGGVA